MKQYLNKQARLLESLLDYPEADEQFYRVCASVVNEVARRAAKEGLSGPGLCNYCTPLEALRAVRSVQLPRSEFLTVEEAGQALGLSPRSVYDRIKRGEIPAVKMGRSFRVRLADLGWPSLDHFGL